MAAGLCRAPEQPVRMLCASLAWSPASGGFPDHDGAERYARQRRCTDTTSPAPFRRCQPYVRQAEGLRFRSGTLDRVHYLLAALKRNGIYWIIDGLSSPRAPTAATTTDGMQTAISSSAASRLRAVAHWSKLQETFLASVNPYTGTATIRDDALALGDPCQ